MDIVYLSKKTLFLFNKAEKRETTDKRLKETKRCAL